jgi:tRNA1Val (adenine37-N6)-methyltransferase
MSHFDFKHFSIQQQHSALKVGTDAMLLGSFAHFKTNVHLLDIGTGTGVLSLMMAQRFQFENITALEIDENALKDATINLQQSPFESNFRLLKQAFQSFQPEHLFDAIISNPPYFINSQQNIDTSKARARHTASLSYDDLIRGIIRCLTPEGKAWIILPIESLEELKQIISSSALIFIQELIYIEGKPGKTVRIIVCLTKKMTLKIQQSTFIIRDDDNSYTAAYKVLTKEFHNKIL